MGSDLIIKKPAIHGSIDLVEFRETKEQNDEVPCVRLYCTQHATAFNLQIRGTVPLGVGNKPRNLIATVSISFEDLVEIEKYVADLKAKMVADHYDEQRCELQNKPTE